MSGFWGRGETPSPRNPLMTHICSGGRPVVLEDESGRTCHGRTGLFETAAARWLSSEEREMELRVASVALSRHYEVIC